MILLVLTLLVSLPASAFEYRDVQVLKVKDGDTVLVRVEVWPQTFVEVNIREDGVNTPEKRPRKSSCGDSPNCASLLDCERKAGIAATNFTARWVAGAEIRGLTLRNVRLGKFAGRALGNLHNGRESLRDALIKSGHGEPYDGGKRGAWCATK